GATYGFAAISTAARSLEAALEGEAAGSTLLAKLTRGLLEACDQALSMPLDSSPLEPEPVPAASVPAENRPTLLLVDDDPAMLGILAASLQEDMEVAIARDAQEGLEFIRRRHPDLVLLDDNMPGMSGMAFLELLQIDPVYRSIPIIMLTASGAAENVM